MFYADLFSRPGRLASSGLLCDISMGLTPHADIDSAVGARRCGLEDEVQAALQLAGRVLNAGNFTKREGGWRDVGCRELGMVEDIESVEPGLDED